jgi:hypothetical protein
MSPIKIKRMAGFEPATSTLAKLRSNQLSYTRNILIHSAPGRNRTDKPYGRGILSALCLPISPQEQNGWYFIPPFYRGESTYSSWCHPHTCFPFTRACLRYFPCTGVVVSRVRASRELIVWRGKYTPSAGRFYIKCPH